MLMTKRISVVFAMVLLLTFSANPVFAGSHQDGHSHDLHEHEFNDVTAVKQKVPGEVVPYVGEAIFEHEMPALRLADVIVEVTSPIDAQWRNTYTDYYFEANRAVERADDALIEEFGINFLSVAQPHWTSTSGNSSTILNNARNNHGLTYDGNKTADVMIAFSGRAPSDSTTAGRATINNAYSVIFDNGYDTNAETTQHEAGHMYGLRHDEDMTGSEYDGTDCVMTAVGFGFIDRFCDGHHRDWSAASRK